MDVGGKLVGDPVDSAALKAINWSYCHANSTAGDVPMKGGEGKEEGLSMEGGEVRVTICHRNRFVSQVCFFFFKFVYLFFLFIGSLFFFLQLQRMSTVVLVKKEGGRRKGISEGVYCLVKVSLPPLLSLSPPPFLSKYFLFPFLFLLGVTRGYRREVIPSALSLLAHIQSYG